MQGKVTGVVLHDDKSGLRVTDVVMTAFTYGNAFIQIVTPEQRLIRAQAFVEAGNLSAAMLEVAAMPGAPAAQSWMVRAKRYADARKALVRLEEMALIRPVVMPVAAQAPAAEASVKP